MRWLTFTLARVFHIHPVYAQMWAHILIYFVLIPTTAVGAWLIVLKVMQ